MSKQKHLGYPGAMRALERLIEQTEAAIDIYSKRGDSGAIAKLAFEQRHNLKVLFKNLEAAKKGKK